MRPLNKWATFGASIPVALSSGVVYCFSVWSEELKEAYGLTQSQLQLIGAAANMGGLLAILAGLLYDALIDWHQLGPRLVLVLGSALNLGGYLFIWAAVTQCVAASGSGRGWWVPAGPCCHPLPNPSHPLSQPSHPLPLPLPRPRPQPPTPSVQQDIAALLAIAGHLGAGLLGQQLERRRGARHQRPQPAAAPGDGGGHHEVLRRAVGLRLHGAVSGRV